MATKQTFRITLQMEVTVTLDDRIPGGTKSLAVPARSESLPSATAPGSCSPALSRHKQELASTLVQHPDVLEVYLLGYALNEFSRKAEEAIPNAAYHDDDVVEPLLPLLSPEARHYLASTEPTRFWSEVGTDLGNVVSVKSKAHPVRVESIGEKAD